MHGVLRVKCQHSLFRLPALPSSYSLTFIHADLQFHTEGFVIGSGHMLCCLCASALNISPLWAALDMLL